ncbi:uncharacterized protein LOC144476904 [Augochlora pura]
MRSNATIKLFASLTVLCALAVMIMPDQAYARPPPLLSRQRRVSDQRLAEIETLLGLENVRGKVVTVPVAFGVLDPDKIGRRRRSATNNRLEALQRFVRYVANNPDVLDDENILSLPMKIKESLRGNDVDYQFI